MTDEDLARDEAICAKATPGPWSQCGAGRGGCVCGLVWSVPADTIVAHLDAAGVIDLKGHWLGRDGSPPTDYRADAAFVAAARTGWPRALEEVKSLRSERDQFRTDHGAIIVRYAAERAAYALLVEERDAAREEAHDLGKELYDTGFVARVALERGSDQHEATLRTIARNAEAADPRDGRATLRECVEASDRRVKALEEALRAAEPYVHGNCGNPECTGACAAEKKIRGADRAHDRIERPEDIRNGMRRREEDPRRPRHSRAEHGGEAMSGGKRGNQGPVLRNYRKITSRLPLRDTRGFDFVRCFLSCGHSEDHDKEHAEHKMVWCSTCERKDTRP